MKALGYILILIWTIIVNGQTTFVKILEQGEIKGLEKAAGADYIIAGTKRGREQDLFVASMDGDANIKWIKQFGTNGIDNFERDGFLKTSTNTFLLLRNSSNYLDSTSFCVVLHLDAEGEIIWTVPFENELGFTLKSIIELDTAFLIIGDDSRDFIIESISKNGKLTRRQTFETPERESVKASARGENGFCIVGNHGAPGKASIFTMIFDESGTLRWKDTLETFNSNLAEDVIF